MPANAAEPLANRRRRGHHLAMTQPETDPTTHTPSEAPHGWQEELEHARADVAAGRTYDADDFLAELRAEDALWAAEAEAAKHKSEPIS